MRIKTLSVSAEVQLSAPGNSWLAQWLSVSNWVRNSSASPQEEKIVDNCFFPGRQCCGGGGGIMGGGKEGEKTGGGKNASGSKQ